MSDDLPFQLPPVDPATADDIPATALSAELVAGLLADGDDELVAWALRHALTEAPRTVVFDGLLRDAMELVGERWESGQWSIAEEHLASRTLLRALEQVRPPMSPESRIGPVAVLAGVTGEQHMIGLVCLEQVLTEAGWTVANLGADLPSSDLGQFVARNDVALVALSAGSGRSSAVADAVVAVRVAAGERSIPILVGGRIAREAAIAAESGADGSAVSLADAVRFARTHLPA